MKAGPRAPMHPRGGRSVHQAWRELRSLQPATPTNAARTTIAHGLLTGMDDAAPPVPSREYVTGPQFTPGALATPERTMVMAVFAGTERFGQRPAKSRRTTDTRYRCWMD